MDLNTFLLLFAALLILASLIQWLAARTTLPVTILLAAAGVVIGGGAMVVEQAGSIGPLAAAAKTFADLPIGSGVFLSIFLPALLFQSALTLEVRQILEDAAPILLLAVIAVIVATAVIGAALAPIAGVSIVACLMLGAIVATTDPVAVIAIFRDIGAPARLTRLLGGESLLNDAAAISLFGVLLGILVGSRTASLGAATLSFLWGFAGGVAVGLLGAWLVMLLVGWLRELRVAQVTLTLALPYLVFIAGERAFGASGVVAAVTAGLLCSATGEARMAPADWRFLNDLWEQLAFWASCLIFLLAALLAPGLLVDASWKDAVLLAALVVAALAARAVVLFGLLPLLTVVRLAERIDHRYNAIILWGGLRGAATLALALAVQENDHIAPDVQRFVAVLATGFVLFTLVVNGLTLRLVIRTVGLDRLSPFDEALRGQVLSLSHRHVVHAVRTIGHEYGLPHHLATSIADDYWTHRLAKHVRPARTGPDTEDQTRLGLVGLATRERVLVLEHFAAGTVLGRVADELLRDAERLIERARTGGRDGYAAAAAQQLGFSRRFRVAHLLHRRFSIDRPLAGRLGERFERLLVRRVVLEELGPYVSSSLAPLVGDGITPTLRRVLHERRQMVDAALEGFRAQYPELADVLERRFLERVARRREELEYRKLFRERLIGSELYTVLRRELRAAWLDTEGRFRHDLVREISALLKQMPLFADFEPHQVDHLARLLRPRVAVPDERLISAHERGDRLYVLSSGAAEAVAAGRRFPLTRGDFFGEVTSLLDLPRREGVVAVTYCHLLVLEARDLRALLRRHPAIKRHMERAATTRARTSEDGVAVEGSQRS